MRRLATVWAPWLAAALLAGCLAARDEAAPTGAAEPPPEVEDMARSKAAPPPPSPSPSVAAKPSAKRREVRARRRAKKRPARKRALDKSGAWADVKEMDEEAVAYAEAPEPEPELAADAPAPGPEDLSEGRSPFGKEEAKKERRVGEKRRLVVLPTELPEAKPAEAPVTPGEDSRTDSRTSKRGGRDRLAGLDASKLDRGLARGPGGGESTVAPPRDDAWRWVRPPRLLPRVGYFENTYLGGSAAYTERLRRLDAAFGEGLRPYAEAWLPQQPFDAPADAGVALSVHLDRRSFDKPGRVFLQVGLQGSRRYGWRRPPLDVVLVIDGSALAPGRTLAEDALMALLRRLGPPDRLGVVLSDPRPETLVPPGPIRDLRRVLASKLERLSPQSPGTPGDLGGAMALAGRLLDQAARDEARIPGTKIVLTLASGAGEAQVQSASRAAHRLSLEGAVTSNIEAGNTGVFWEVAHAGHGNYHAVDVGDGAGGVDVDQAITAELDAVSRVVARLLRINVRLAPGVEAVRIVGSRMLGQEEAQRVKAREVATDRRLSETLGVKADRGEDDDGLQTVIPYFYGGDAHVVLLELWVEEPGPVADVSLKYKDMVALDNATARAGTSVTRTPRPDTPLELAVQANVRGFHLAEGLRRAADTVRRGDLVRARQLLGRLAETAEADEDRRVVEGFSQLLEDPGWRRGGQRGDLGEALRMASERRVGHVRR